MSERERHMQNKEVQRDKNAYRNSGISPGFQKRDNNILVIDESLGSFINSTVIANRRKQRCLSTAVHGVEIGRGLSTEELKVVIYIVSLS